VNSIRTKGRFLEAETLFEATKLYLEGRLEVYWGTVHIIQDRLSPQRDSSEPRA